LQPTNHKSRLSVLIIGYGSIGRRHAKVLASLTSSLVIVNRRESVRAQAMSDYPAALVVDCLEALDETDFSWEATTAVIATWGPSHAELFHTLVDRGVCRILCEKPMASSVQDAHDMAVRADREGIMLGLNHTLRYAGLAPALRRFATEYHLGEPVGALFEGGAADLLTNGVHWIDFFIELFNASPRQVISTAHGEPINPRSPDLQMFGGTAVWSFEDGREAVITLSNRSSVFPHARIYFRDAVVTAGYVPTEMDAYLYLVTQHRDRSAIKQFPAVTRTGPAKELIFEGQLPGVRQFNAGLQTAAQELLYGDKFTCSGFVGATALSACIGALVAAQEQKVIELPIAPDSMRGQEHWPIS
jgi:predicted dehydrogenase